MLSVVDRQNRLPSTHLAYGFLLLGAITSFSALPDWRMQLALSLLAVVVLGKLTGRSLPSGAGGVVASVTVVLLKADPSGLPLGYRLIGLLAAALCAVPLLRRQPSHGGFPLLGVFLVIQGVYIYVGALVARPGLVTQATYPVRIRDLGLLGSLVYVSVMLCAGLLAQRARPVLRSLPTWTSRVTAVPSPNATFVRAVVLFAIGLAALRALPPRVAADLGAIPSIVGLARLAGLALMVLLWLRGSLRPAQKAFVLLLLVIDATLGISSAFALYDAVGGVLVVLITLLVLRPRRVAWLALVLLPVVILLNAAKVVARADPQPASGTIPAVGRLLSDAKYIAHNSTGSILTTSADRFDNSELLGYVEYHVPRDYPYWNKQSYTELPLVLLPRIIAPFKPRDTLANQFGRRYGLLNPDDFSTSDNTPLQVEAWANFGPEGLIGIAVINGILLGLGGALFRRRTMDGLVLGALVAYQVIAGVESGISAWVLVVPVVVIYGPVVRWTLGASQGQPATAALATDVAVR
jgi:hypothetical protein